MSDLGVIDSSDRFEIKARAFRRTTGHFPPGKDAPLGSQSESDYEQSRLAWEVWCREYGHIVDGVILAVEELGNGGHLQWLD